MRYALAIITPLAVLPALTIPTLGPALAQTARESSETRLNRQLELDRQRDRANEARRRSEPPGPETTRAMNEDRRSLGPDVGRPEESGRIETGGERGALTGGMNPQR